MKKIKPLKIEKNKVDDVKKTIKSCPLYIAKHVVQFSIVLLLIALLIGAGFFYKNNILAVKKEIEGLDNSCPLNESNYNKVLKAWDDNDKRFNEASYNYYNNIFSGEIID